MDKAILLGFLTLIFTVLVVGSAYIYFLIYLIIGFARL